MEVNMKQFIIAIIFVMIISTCTFAEALDEQYTDLIFGKFASYDEATRIQKVEELKLHFSSKEYLDILYIGIVITKKDKMDQYGITENTLMKNINALKEWDYADRMALVDAGASGDRQGLINLNNKYKASEPSGGNDQSNGSTAPTTPPSSGVISGLPTTPTEEIEVTLIEKLETKGFITKAIPKIKTLENKEFVDTDKHWSKADVSFLVERGIIKGKDENTFAPEDNITKAEITALIMRLIVSDAEKLDKYEDTIPDIETGQWYDEEMKRAYVLGLIHKSNEGFLEPSRKSSREEVVEILVNAIKTLEIPIADEVKMYDGDFKDFDQVDASRKEAMTIAINLGFINGMGDRDLAPNAEITRGQIAAVIKRVYLYIITQVSYDN